MAGGDIRIYTPIARNFLLCKGLKWKPINNKLDSSVPSYRQDRRILPQNDKVRQNVILSVTKPFACHSEQPEEAKNLQFESK
jgi:hypothetical protein